MERARAAPRRRAGCDRGRDGLAEQTTRSKCSETRFRPAAPSCRRRAESSRRRSIAAARAPGSPGGTRSPVSPSTTSSGTPPTLEATTGKSGRHGLQDRERQAFGAARQHEQVCCREELPDVVPLAGEANHRLQPEPANLALDGGPIGPVAGDHRLAGSPQLCERANERERILGRLKPADRHEPVGPGATLDGCGARKLDPVVDHHRRRLVTCPGLEAGAALALGDADGRRGHRPEKPLRPSIHDRARPTMRRERPAVHRVDADRDTREPGCKASQRRRLGAVDVNNVRPFSPYERRELEQATEVTQRAERTSDVLELDEAHAGRLHALAKRPAAVRRHGHVEMLWRA